jgi:hypothetical protein
MVTAMARCVIAPRSKYPKTGHYTKRDGDTGRFMDVKSDGGKFKGVRTEKKK